MRDIILIAACFLLACTSALASEAPSSDIASTQGKNPNTSASAEPIKFARMVKILNSSSPE